MPEFQSTVMHVLGMECENCVKAIENVCESFDGIQDVDVELAEESVTVVFDADLVSITEICEAIDYAGFEIVRENTD